MKSNNYPLPSIFVVVLVFFFLVNKAQAGIRLGNYGTIKHIGQIEKTLDEESSHEGFRKITLCENRHCNSGNNRKLLTVTSPIPLSPTPSTRNNEEGNYKKGNPKSSNKEEAKKGNMENSEEISKNIEGSLDLVDIAEMDYSPAKRKPPIHN